MNRKVQYSDIPEDQIDILAKELYSQRIEDASWLYSQLMKLDSLEVVDLLQADLKQPGELIRRLKELLEQRCTIDARKLAVRIITTE